MSEQEKFLARWSRRKLEATDDVASDADEKTKPATPDKGREPGCDSAGDPQPAAAAKNADAPAFDLTSLPSLESIGPNSDIRAFLQAGVPAALSRAALRRAWSADPAIRDFIGLSENSWDFTATNAAMGFGPLEPGKAARHLAEFLGDSVSKAAQSPTVDNETAQITQSEPQHAADPDAGSKDLPAKDQSAEADTSETSGTTQPDEELLRRSNDDDAPQRKPLPARVASRRGHGGALPE